ncbi:hypothetical protein BGW80DRAFT_1559745 [Lactifluus volemus]|nr:hypothetical protein BGW80DRAFT_1559745 [Lactifluus volemus]
MGDLHPPPKAIALHDQPSNKVSAGPSASAEGSSLSTPYVSPASKRGDMVDSPSHGTTRKEEQLNHAGSKYKTLFVGSEAFEGHSDNLRDSPLPPYPLAVCQGQGDPAAKESQEARETVWNDQEEGPGSAGGDNPQ